jgi:mannose-6-phosphate isomerase-like protein (cupin superfamily)
MGESEGEGDFQCQEAAVHDGGRGVSRGFVTDAPAVDAVTADQTALERVTIDRNAGCEHLEQRVLEYGRGRAAVRSLPGVERVLYVVSGEGTLELEGVRHDVGPDTGAYVAPGEEYTFEVDGGGEPLVVVAVDAPIALANPDIEVGPRQAVVRLAEQAPLPASGGREFRFVVTPDVGCQGFTQFVGEIPPGRAPDHSHTYDEVIYVLEGSGRLHLGGEVRPIAAGSCIHLPPLQLHCLENVGPGTMRVLGVFHPAGDPASRAYEADQA